MWLEAWIADSSWDVPWSPARDWSRSAAERPPCSPRAAARARAPPRARPEGPAQRANFGAAKFQLSWIEDVEFAGEYIADTKGYYTQAGFSSMNLLAGGAGVNQDDVVAVGPGPRLHLVAGHHRGQDPQGAGLITHRGAVPEEPLLHHVADEQARSPTRRR